MIQANRAIFLIYVYKSYHPLIIRFSLFFNRLNVLYIVYKCIGNSTQPDHVKTTFE